MRLLKTGLIFLLSENIFTWLTKIIFATGTFSVFLLLLNEILEFDMEVTAIGLHVLNFGQKLHTNLYYMKEESEDAGEDVRIDMPICVFAVGC